MAVYICANCDECIDEDIGGCNECPSDECECICDACYMDLEEQFELLINR